MSVFGTSQRGLGRDTKARAATRLVEKASAASVVK
jgi:hypothetical protein